MPWILVAHGLSPVEVRGGFSCYGTQAVGAQASVAVVRGTVCSGACGIFPGQGMNLCPLHWQMDSSPLDQQGNPTNKSLTLLF